MGEYALGEGVTLLRYASWEELDALRWDGLPGLPPWLHTFWLRAFAQATCPAPDSDELGARTEYLEFARDGQMCGVSLLQHLPAANMKLGERWPSALGPVVLGAHWHQFGQVLFGGGSGIHFADRADVGRLLAEARCALRAGLDEESVWLAKDLTVPVELDGWQQLDVLPEMRMELPGGWGGSFENYLAALPSKYRRRAKRTRRQFEGLLVRELDAEAVQAHSERLDALYAALIERSPYVPFRAPRGYLPRLKRAAGGRLTVRGYFDAERLVGFSTLLSADCEALAHFAAVDPAYNRSHNLYLNLLFDLLESALRLGAERLNYGRTATTIKSSVGAVPVAQYSYASHDGWLRNHALGVLGALHAPLPELVQRPFG